MKISSREVDHLFATPVTVIQFEEIEKIKNYGKIILDDLSEQQKENLKLIGHCTSEKDDLHLNKKFSELFRSVNDEVNLYFDEYLGLDKSDIRMECSWYNVHTYKSNHSAHEHPNSFYTGVLYLEIEGESNKAGDIYFMDPRPAKNMDFPDYKKESSLSHRDWWYTPEIGTMLLFPSWLTHGVKTCFLEEGKYRVCIAFTYSVIKASNNTMKLGYY